MLHGGGLVCITAKVIVMAHERTEFEEKQQNAPRDLLDFDEDEMESQALYELVALEANERLSDAEDEYEEAMTETEAAKEQLDLRQKETDQARRENTQDPSDDNRYQLLQAMLAKKEAAEQVTMAQTAEKEAREDYQKALKKAIMAEVRKDYSDLKPQAEALKKLEDKQQKLVAEIKELKASGDDGALKAKSRKLENLNVKIDSQKEKLANVVDKLLAKNMDESRKVDLKAERKVENKTSKQEPLPQKNQIEYRTISAQFLLSESIRHEAALRHQLNSMNQKQEVFKKLIAGKSQYAEKSEFRYLRRGLATLEKVGRKLSHEISHENKVMEKLKAGITAGQTEVIRPHHARASEPINFKQEGKRKEVPQPEAVASKPESGSIIPVQEAPKAQPATQEMTSYQDAPKHTKAKQIIAQTQAGDEASQKRSEAIEKYISLSMLVENEIMESLKKGENVEQNLGEGVQTMLDVIDVVVSRNEMLKDQNDFEAGRQMIHKQHHDQDTREQRSIASEIKYGVYKGKSGSQTGTGTGAAASADSSSIAPARSGSNKLK
jgi:hypothetical protein